MITCRITQEENEIGLVLTTFNDSFPRPISTRIGDISVYASKLARNAVVIVADYNLYLAGFAALYANDTFTQQAYLAQLAVLQEYRGKKIGIYLLDKCERVAKAREMKTLKLEVDKKNEHAIQFYTKNGFFKKLENVDSIFMEKVL